MCLNSLRREVDGLRPPQAQGICADIRRTVVWIEHAPALQDSTRGVVSGPGPTKPRPRAPGFNGSVELADPLVVSRARAPKYPPIVMFDSIFGIPRPRRHC